MKKLWTYLFLIITLVGSIPFLYPTDNPRDSLYILRSKQGSLCSSVLFAPGRLFTANHCLGVTDFVEYKTKHIPYTVLWKDEKQDIAIIQAIGVECPCAKLKFDALVLDEPLYKYGYGLYPTIGVMNVTIGNYMGLFLKDEATVLITTSPIAPGDSGGGIFVKRWGTYYLVAIVSAVAVTAPFGIPQLIPHLGIAIPISILHQE